MQSGARLGHHRRVRCAEVADPAQVAHQLGELVSVALKRLRQAAPHLRLVERFGLVD